MVCTRVRRMAAQAAVIAAVSLGAASSAQAGPVGDGLEAFARWVSGVETRVVEWADKAWHAFDGGKADEGSQALIRAMIIEPDSIAAVAERAGFRLESYRLPLGGAQSLTLRLIHDRALTVDERVALLRLIDTMSSKDVEGQRRILEILADAAEWRDIGERTGYLLTGVVVVADDKAVHANLEYGRAPDEGRAVPGLLSVPAQ